MTSSPFHGPPLARKNDVPLLFNVADFSPPSCRACGRAPQVEHVRELIRGVRPQAVLAELGSERRWDELFAGSTDVLSELAEEALAEHRAGCTKPLDLDRP